MRITQDVRDYAKTHGVNEEKALEEGLQEKAEEFRRQGGEIYKTV
jgi:phosphomethylpyrimidine synthase